MATTIKIEGLEKTLARLDINKFKPEIQKCFDRFGFNTEREAIQAVVVDDSLLKQSIHHLNGELSSGIAAGAEYAAYVEFGTGRFAAAYVATLPEQWQLYARTFYVNGKGRLPAHPFIYPAFNKNQAKLIEDIKKIKV